MVLSDARSALLTSRQQGVGGLDKAASFVLEADGSPSVISSEKLGMGSAIDGGSSAYEQLKTSYS